MLCHETNGTFQVFRPRFRMTAGRALAAAGQAMPGTAETRPHAGVRRDVRSPRKAREGRRSDRAGPNRCRAARSSHGDRTGTDFAHQGPAQGLGTPGDRPAVSQRRRSLWTRRHRCHPDRLAERRDCGFISCCASGRSYGRSGSRRRHQPGYAGKRARMSTWIMACHWRETDRS